MTMPETLEKVIDRSKNRTNKARGTAFELLPLRLQRKISRSEGGCWNWTGATSNGYGKTWLDGRVVPAHRAVYLAIVGPIPVDLQLDHLCRVRNCVNPDHLEPVTQRVNILRGVAPSAVHAAKTRCPQSHPYSGENLYVSPSGQRKCRECNRLQQRKPPRSTCLRGHPLERSYRNRHGKRICRDCVINQQARHRARKAAQ